MKKRVCLGWLSSLLILLLVVSVPAFGEYSPVQGNKPLAGYTIGVDPGHQGKGDSSLEKIAPDSKQKKAKVSSGTRGSYTKVYEYQLNLKVGLKLKKELEDLGAKVIITRSTDDINISNAERATLTNENHCDMVIRLHANGASNSKTRGYSILVPGKTYSVDSVVLKSRAFSLLLDKELKGEIKIPSRGIVVRNDLTGFNWAKTPVVLLEMGYMTNKIDDKTMETEGFQTGVVKAISSALIEYFK